MSFEDQNSKSEQDVSVQKYVDQLHTCPKCGLSLPSSISNCPDDGTFLGSTLGKNLSVQYEFLEEIGAGGNGVVYKARHRLLNHIVAIKMLRANQLEQRVIRRFNQEAKVISTLDHAAIVKLRDFGITEVGQPYMVLDYVPGDTLSTYLASTDFLPHKDFIKTFTQCCDGLQHAHDAGILHRDVKPSNIMLSDDFNVKILDFGIAKIVDLADQAAGLTKTGEIFGSPKYMSPEQANGKRMDHRSDIYSLGIVMFEALTGTPPFAGSTAVEILASQINSKAPSIAAYNPNLPTELQAIVTKCLAKEPFERFQSMSELKTALLEVKDGTKAKSVVAAKFKKSEIVLIVTSLVLVGGIAVLVPFMIDLAKPLEIRKPVEEIEELASLTNGGKVAREYFRTHINEKVISLDENFRVWIDVTDDSLSEFDKTNVTEDLSMRGTKLKGPGLAHLIHLPLRRLALSTCYLSNRAIDEVKHMKKLQILDISGTNISDKGLVQLASLLNLNTLYLKDEENITNEGLANLATIPHLQTLNLSKDAWLRGSGIKNLANCPDLKILRLDKSGISDVDLIPIKDLKILKLLALRDTKIGDAGVQNLEISTVAQLDLQNSHITDKCLCSLAKMRHLKELGLHHCKLTPKAIDELQRQRPDLKIWRIDDVPFNSTKDNR